MATKHKGFKAVQNEIAKKEGVSKKEAGAILASKTRNASKKAKEKNPMLNKVKGVKKFGDGGKAKTPFQQYMKVPGAVASDTVAKTAAVKKNPALLNVKRGTKKYNNGGKTGPQLKSEGLALKLMGESKKLVGKSMKKVGQELTTQGKQIKRNNPLTSSELKALSHQQRGMPLPELGLYRNNKNKLGMLNSTEKAQLKRYMNKASIPQKIYEALPNLGESVGKGASYLPSKSKLNTKLLREGGVIQPPKTVRSTGYKVQVKK